MRRSLTIMFMLTNIFTMLTGCLPRTSGHDGVILRQNLGDQIIPRLHIGMSSTEVDNAIGELKKYLTGDRLTVIKSDRDIYSRYSDNYFPKDLLTSIEVGAHFRSLSYWTNYAGRDLGTLELYFDENTQSLRGWVNTESTYSRERFLHERLSSRLQISFDVRSRLTRTQVQALIGLPTRTIDPPSHESHQLYHDHYWVSDSALTPTINNTNQLDVYEYDLDSGDKRHVYVAYTRANDRLLIYGYDHAWEEAGRYSRERESKNRN